MASAWHSWLVPGTRGLHGFGIHHKNFLHGFFPAHNLLDEMSKLTFILDNITVLGFLLTKLVLDKFVQFFVILKNSCNVCLVLLRLLVVKVNLI